MLLNKHNLAVADFASKEQSRYTLQAIQVSEKGTCATDRHQLVRVSLSQIRNGKNFPVVPGVVPANGEIKPFLLDVVSAKQIAAAIPKKTTIPILNHALVCEPDEATNSACIAVTNLNTNQVFRPRMGQEQFPNVEAVIPNGDMKPVFEIAVSGELLARIVKAAAGFSDQRSSQTGSPVLLSFYGADKVMTIQARRNETKQRFLSVLMPIALAETKAEILK